jgi:hypothetical protein
MEGVQHDAGLDARDAMGLVREAFITAARGRLLRLEDD